MRPEDEVEVILGGKLWKGNLFELFSLDGEKYLTALKIKNPDRYSWGDTTADIIEKLLVEDLELIEK